MSTPADSPGFRLSDADVERIARRVIELQGLLAPKPVFTTEEAMEFVKKRSATSLGVWVRRFAPNSRCGHGRYTRAALMKGLEKEALQFAPGRKRSSRPQP